MNETKVRVGAGLIALVLVAVGLNVGGEHYLAKQRDEAAHVRQSKLQIPHYVARPQGKSEIQALPEPLQTNYEAQKAIKYQCGNGGCSPNPASATFAAVNWGRPYGGDIYPGKVLPDGAVVTKVGPSYTTPPVRPTVTPSPVTPPTPKPTPAQADARNRPEAKKYQLLLFVDESPQGQRLLSWFSKGGDPTLLNLRSASNYQEFTRDNPLYKSRYSTIVPPEQFPALVFQDATGGHIHACGRLTIPDSPEQLFDDIRSGHDLYKQAKTGTQAIEASNSGMVKSEGYNFAEFVDPKLRLSDENCPDGICPVDPPGWRPGDRVRDVADRLFDRRKPDGIEGLFISWVSGPERVTMLVTYVLIGLIVLVTFLKWQKAKSDV